MRRPTPEEVIDTVCEVAGVEVERIRARDMFGSLRKGKDNFLCSVRGACVVALRRLCDMSYPEAATAVGFKSHTPARDAAIRPCPVRDGYVEKAVAQWEA